VTVPGIAVTFLNSPTYLDICVETGEVMLKANWHFGAGPLVAKD